MACNKHLFLNNDTKNQYAHLFNEYLVLNTVKIIIINRRNKYCILIIYFEFSVKMSKKNISCFLIHNIVMDQ